MAMVTSSDASAAATPRDEAAQAGHSQISAKVLELAFLAAVVVVLVAWIALLAWFALSL